MAQVDLKLINKAVEDKWITKRNHPTLPLAIYTYSKRTEIENNWNDITKMCRGLILDDQGNIVGNPFPKFFGVWEQSKEKICGNKLLKHKSGEYFIPDEKYRIFSKEDGSIIFICKYQDNLVVASKGSFESDQVKWATELLNTKYAQAKFAEGYTYIAELVVPQNRIVLDYKDEQALYIIGIRDNENNKDLSFAMCESFADKFNFKLPAIYNKKIEQCLDELDLPFENREGYVVHFADGNKIKIKFASYLNLHRIITQITSKDVIEFMARGENILDFCASRKDIPDKIISDIKRVEYEYLIKFKKIEDIALRQFEKIKSMTRKEQALHIQQLNQLSVVKSIIFAIISSKDYYKIIFNYLKNEEKNNRIFIGTCS